MDCCILAWQVDLYPYPTDTLHDVTFASDKHLHVELASEEHPNVEFAQGSCVYF